MVKIEQSINQLLELMELLSREIVQQERVIQDIEDKTETAAGHLGQANTQIEKSTASALRARKLKWWCFFICVLIVVIIAVIVGVYFGVTKAASGNK